MKSIKLLLTTNVDNLGIVGDVVDVKPGFARNFLIPRGMATDPTSGNIARLAGERERVAEDMRRQRAADEELIKQLEGFEIIIQRTANEQGVLFGGISQHDIAELIRAEGFNVEDRSVRIGEQVKRLDSYDVPIVLANDLKTEVKLQVVSDKPAEEMNTEDEEAETNESESELEPEERSEVESEES